MNDYPWFERGHVAIVTGASKGLDLAVTRELARAGISLVIDARDYPEVHPLLTPLVLNLVTQWFTVWSAVLRGIADLDERVFMGRHVLAEGGHRWP